MLFDFKVEGVFDKVISIVYFDTFFCVWNGFIYWMMVVILMIEKKEKWKGYLGMMLWNGEKK